MRCRPEAHFTTTEEGVERAEETCLAECKAFVQCGAYADAIDTKRLVGVWGGALRGSREDQISKPRPTTRTGDKA